MTALHQISIDVVAAVNNKLNTLTLDLEEELLRVYETLKEFFASIGHRVLRQAQHERDQHARFYIS